MGTWRETIESLQFGTSNCVFESVGTLDRYDPLAGIEAYPYLIRDIDHFKKVYFGPVGAELYDEIAKRTNFRIIGAIYRGSRNLTSNKKVENVGDLKGLKIRVPPLKMYKLTWQYLGASGVPMSFLEVFTGLQQGIIDAQENPLPTIHDHKINEVCKYLVMTKHVIGAMTFIFYEPWFQNLPQDIKKIIRDDIEEASTWCNGLQFESEENLKNTLVNEKGMLLIEPDLVPFRSKIKGMINEFPELQEWYEKIKAIQ
jgi:tripartite ATP-independent transporter DctP family solute receptor